MPYEVEISSSNSKTKSKAKGDVKLLFGDYELTLRDVLYAPDLKVNVMSTERLKRENNVGYTNIDIHRLVDIPTMKTITRPDSS